MITANCSRFNGVLQILRFNIHQYVLAIVCIIVSVPLVAVTPLTLVVKWAVGLSAVCALYWSVASIIVSHVVYDRSNLTSWRWLSNQLPARLWKCGRWINIHAGFDDTTLHLRRMMKMPPVSVIDLYDSKLMTEHSITVARKVSYRDPSRINASPACLPLCDRSVDVVFLLMAAHEIRDPEMRKSFFRQLNRLLDYGGRVVLAEHLRDVRNFLAFGPGYLHFFSRREWMQLAQQAGFGVVSEMKNTPFVTLFVLEKEHEPDDACANCGDATAVAGGV